VNVSVTIKTGEPSIQTSISARQERFVHPDRGELTPISNAMHSELTQPDTGDAHSTGLGDPAASARARSVDEAEGDRPDLHRLLVDSIRDYAIFGLDPAGHVLTWNRGAERVKGWTANEIIGRHFSAFYPADAVATRFPQHELKVATAEGRFEDEGWRVRKDGSRFWASVVITAVVDDAGQLIGFAKVTRDLTERKEAQERAFRDACRVAELEAASRAKSEFLNTLSHELRTPLNAISGYTDLLTLEVPGTVNETQRDYLERIRSSQQHLLALVNDMLSLSHLEADAPAYVAEAVRIDQLLHDLQTVIQPWSHAKGIAFSAGDCPCDVSASASVSGVQQILLNLLSNAIKFTPAGGRISLACAVTDSRVAISVSDTGPGIPEAEQESIFEPFVQLGRSLTCTREGIGIGLAISRNLARAMAGDLTVASVPDEGSTFTLVLPRAAPASP
jgi:PAS domain S-box-containing protein